MKATIMESAGGRMVILAEDGSFYSVEGSGQVGDIIEYSGEGSGRRHAARRSALIRRAAAIAASLVLVLSGAAYSYQNLMVYADVTLDGSMPVRCSLNRKGEIIKIEALDESGEDLAESMRAAGMKGESMETALEYAEEYIETKGTDGSGGLKISVDCRDEDAERKLSSDLNKKYKEDTANNAAGETEKQKSGTYTNGNGSTGGGDPSSKDGAGSDTNGGSSRDGANSSEQPPDTGHGDDGSAGGSEPGGRAPETAPGESAGSPEN